MKKIALIISFVAIGGFLLNSCTEEETCKQCKIVTTNDTTGVVTEGGPEEKCGDDLIKTQNEAPVTVDSKTAKWVCN